MKNFEIIGSTLFLGVVLGTILVLTGFYLLSDNNLVFQEEEIDLMEVDSSFRISQEIADSFNPLLTTTICKDVVDHIHCATIGYDRPNQTYNVWLGEEHQFPNISTKDFSVARRVVADWFYLKLEQ